MQDVRGGRQAGAGGGQFQGAAVKLMISMKAVLRGLGTHCPSTGDSLHELWPVYPVGDRAAIKKAVRSTCVDWEDQT